MGGDRLIESNNVIQCLVVLLLPINESAGDFGNRLSQIVGLEVEGEALHGDSCHGAELSAAGYGDNIFECGDSGFGIHCGILLCLIWGIAPDSEYYITAHNQFVIPKIEKNGVKFFYADFFHRSVKKYYTNN